MDHLGNAWHFAIPLKFRDAVAQKNNCLEFLASIITIWQAILNGSSKPHDCFLSLGGNTSSVGWLHKASVDPSKNYPLFIAARKFAKIMLYHNSCIYSQHISGVSNKIADILSRRFDLTDDQLISHVHSYLPFQVPVSFKICLVHPEIISWTTCWLQRCNGMKGSPQILKTKSAECGEGGLLTRMPLDSPKTFGSPTSTQNSAPISLAFAAALRRREFSTPDPKCLVASTVQEAVAKLGETFRANVGYIPSHRVGTHTLHPLLARQFKGMRNLDPGERQQKALPVSVYRELHRVANSSKLLLDAVIAGLQTMAYFWCLRSCEYSDVQGERRTKLLCVRNFRFFVINNRDISQNWAIIDTAVTVSITFEFQKKEVRNDTISHQQSGDSVEQDKMCPVRATIGLITRIRSYNISLDKLGDLPINYVEFEGKGFTILSSMILLKICRAVSSLGQELLGFSADEVGTHSNRSGGAMGMFLAGTPVYTIMLMGRWSSDAFMKYIRKQVLSLSHGIATKMLTFERFYTVPDFVHLSRQRHERSP